MGHRTTIRDIARHAGVSVGTASNVLNARAGVDQELQNRVRKAVEELNYRVNIHARGMILRRSFNIGVVIPSLTDPFFPQFASFLEQAIEDRGSHVVIASSRNDPARERAVCDALVSKQVDGLILTPCCRENAEYFNGLIADGLSIVQLGRYYEEIHSPIVMIENQGTGRAAAELLHEAGHRRIVHLAGSPDSNPDRLRASGFRAAIEDLGIEAECAVLDASNPEWQHGAEAKLLSADAPTGVFAADDMIGLSFLKLARRLGIDVPGQISVVSIGSVFPSEAMLVDLSTFAIDPAEMSRVAAELLFSRIDARRPHSDNSPTCVVVPAVFREGETIQLV